MVVPLATGGQSLGRQDGGSGGVTMGDFVFFLKGKLDFF